MTTHSAEVVSLHPGATWDAVREAYGRMQQMGWQSVLQAARVGAMLIELKRETPHGEWDVNVNRALQTKAARQTAFNLMRLAANLPMLEQHRPESQRAAIALIKQSNPKRQKPHEYREGWTVLLLRHGLVGGWATGNMESRNTKRAELFAKIGYKPPKYFTDKEAAQKFVDDCRGFLTPAPQREEFTETQQHKIARAVEKEKQQLHDAFDANVREASKDRVREAWERAEKVEIEFKQERDWYRAANEKASYFISKEDVKFLLQVLHPDRAPRDRSEQFSRAFQIVMKLKPHFGKEW